MLCQSRQGLIGLLEKVGLDADSVGKIARNVGFVQRHSGKLQPFPFACTYCYLVANASVSFNDLAAAIHADCGVSMSRQALWERLDDECLLFLNSLLHKTLAYKSVGPAKADAARRFSRILVQDSTIVGLPTELLSVFSGVGNGTSARCHARIQVIVDVVGDRFECFSVDAYSRNDFDAASDLLARPGDLVLRDRGYYSQQAVQRLIAQGADLITRHRLRMKLFDPCTGADIDLLGELKRHSTLDRQVRLGKCGPVLRLVAAPVSTELANNRRRQLKLSTHGHRPTPDLLALCGWTVYLTTLTDPTIEMRDLLGYYGLRWRIECLFKAWKSHLKFAVFHRVSAIQARLMLTARLLLITLVHHMLWIPLSIHAAARGEVLSVEKFYRYLSLHGDRLLTGLSDLAEDDKQLLGIIRYCKYDRRTRPNYETELLELHQTTRPHMP